jgi:transposase InsO family protein
VTTDNGGEFQSDFKHLLSRLGIHHINTSANHPNANGVIERLNQTIKRMLIAHHGDYPNNWIESLPIFASCLYVSCSYLS